MPHTQFQPNIPSGSGEKVDFIGFANFGNGGHFGFLTPPEFYHSEGLQSDHAACKI